MSTTPLPLTLGAGPVPAQVDGNTPAGYCLINTDAAATVTVKAGATGPVIAALQPGGSLVWRDPAVYPYVSAAGGAATTALLVITDQASDYSNPAAVAAVTATQLAAQGLPNVLRDTDLGTYRIHSGGPSVSQATLTTVGQCSTLVVNCLWPQPTPQGQAYCRLIFDDPTSPSFAPVVLILTSNNAIEGGGGTWLVPVLGPRLRIDQTDTAASDCYVAIVGNNRPAPARVVQLDAANPDATGVRHLLSSCPTAGIYQSCVAGSGVGPGDATTAFVSGGSRLTRMNGPITISAWAISGTGYLRQAWVNSSGLTSAMVYRIGTTPAVTFQASHPAVPCWWDYVPDTAFAGNKLAVVVMQS